MIRCRQYLSIDKKYAQEKKKRKLRSTFERLNKVKAQM